MKTRNFLFYGVFALAFVFTSCEDDPKDEGGSYSTIPVEQHKTNIEDAGFDMFDEVKAMEDEPAVQANISLAGLLDNSNPFSGSDYKKGKLKQTIAFAPVFAVSDIEGSGVVGIAKSIAINPAEDPETIQEVFDELVGIYDWNFTTEDWDYAQTGDDIVFNFPSEQDGTVNNASYTVSYTGYTGPNPIEEYNGDLPQRVSAILNVDNAEVSGLVFNAAYNSEGYPTSVDVTFSLGSYVWYAMASNENNAKFDTEVSFKNGDNILLKFILDATGNWSVDNIEDNFEVTYWVGYWDEDTNRWIEEEIAESELDQYENTWSQEEFFIHKVIKNGNASFQAMNLVVKGAMDIEGFGDKMKEIDETYDWDQEEDMVAEEVKAINEYINLSLRYADTDDIIAIVEAYPVENEYTYYDYVYNEATGDWTEVEVTETDYWFDMRFIFADDSAVDFETYFEDVFEDLITELENWADGLEETYGK